MPDCVGEEKNTSTFSELVLLEDGSSCRAGSLNMALDEILLGRLDTAWLRWYSWDEPTVSVGYFETAPTGIAKPIVRRWTGGGRVEHGGALDYTFAIGVPRESGEAMRRPAESYRQIHAAVARALREAGIDATLASSGERFEAGIGCFRNPVESDVLTSEGQKLVGGAQRRAKKGMLHQGSIQGVRLPDGFERSLAAALSTNWRSVELDREWISEAQSIAPERYPNLSSEPPAG
jgi:lipoate-protein ligase A